jgi:hypothetical protein
MKDVSLEFLASNMLNTAGVRGLIIEDKQSKLTATMLDDVFQNVNLHDYRQQKQALEGIFREAASAPEDLFIEYRDAALYLRQSPICALSLLTDRDINIASLRIAAKLLLQKVTKQALAELAQEVGETSDKTSHRSFDQKDTTSAPPPVVAAAPAQAPVVASKPAFVKPSPPVRATHNPLIKRKKKKKQPPPSSSNGIWG